MRLPRISWDYGDIHVEIRTNGDITIVSTRTSGCIELSSWEITEIVKLLEYAGSISPIMMTTHDSQPQDTLLESDSLARPSGT